MAGPVTQLVKAGRVKTVRVFKSLESGHRNEVPARRVVGLTLAFAKICAGDCYELLHVSVALVQLEGCSCTFRIERYRQVVGEDADRGIADYADARRAVESLYGNDLNPF